MAKILLVEDDARLSKSLKKWLESERYVVEVIADGNDAVQMLSSYRFDIVVLDWGLPGLEGIHVLKRFRDSGGMTPVIFLTGQGDLESKMTGLDAGADDYLTKPFSPEELSARIRTLLRRPAGLLPTVFTVGNVSLDPASTRVTVNGAELKLGKKEFQILEFLMRNHNQCFSTEALRDQVWQSDTDTTEDAVRSCIRVLRRKLSDQGGDNIIGTVPGIGYIVQTNSTAALDPE